MRYSQPLPEPALPIGRLNAFGLLAFDLTSAPPRSSSTTLLARCNRFRSISTFRAAPCARFAGARVMNGAEKRTTGVARFGQVDPAFCFQLLMHFDGQEHVSSRF